MRDHLALTLKDRIVLANQYRILEKVDPANAAGHNINALALECGYALHYDHLAENFYDEMSTGQCEETLEILRMFESLQASFSHLEDKRELKQRDVIFEGFDGNSETKHLGYVSFFIEDMKRYPHLLLARDRFDSHCPMLGVYRRMLVVWRPIFDAHLRTTEFDLTLEEVLKVLDARRHPDSVKKDGLASIGAKG